VSTAHAGCGCRGYAKTVKRDGNVAFELWMKLGASGLKPRQSTRVVKGVKKYARHGRNLPNTPWCLRSPAHAKACKAAVACRRGGAGVAYVNLQWRQRWDGRTERRGRLRGSGARGVLGRVRTLLALTAIAFAVAGLLFVVLDLPGLLAAVIVGLTVGLASRVLDRA
jgi:hypothetical protein